LIVVHPEGNLQIRIFLKLAIYVMKKSLKT